MLAAVSSLQVNSKPILNRHLGHSAQRTDGHKDTRQSSQARPASQSRSGRQGGSGNVWQPELWYQGTTYPRITC